MTLILIFCSMLSTALAVTPAKASSSYLATREIWLATVANRLEVARHLGMQRAENPGAFRSDASLAKAIGLRRPLINSWVNGEARFTLEEGFLVATFFRVEAWWLLGYDVLQKHFWAKHSEAFPESLRPSNFAHPSFGEILIAARTFEPRTCQKELEEIRLIDALAARGELNAIRSKAQ